MEFTAYKLPLNKQKFNDMDTTKKETPEILDFTSFIKNYFPLYEIDGHNSKVIAHLGLWAKRVEKFNGLDHGWHIDRGIILSGPVGAGKDEIFKILRKYLSYLRSPYGYTHQIVWKFSDLFSNQGYACFDDIKGNIYFEELGLTDERSGQPTRELAKYYGNTVLVGAEIITERHRIFKNNGFQSHFSTNLSEDELEKIYGNRCMSRLYEMCNFVVITGKDRRGLKAPQFNHNLIQPAPPAARETTVDEHKENIKILEAEYKLFCDQGITSEAVSINYNLLKVYGCAVATEEEMRIFMELAGGSYQAPVLTEFSKSQKLRDKDHHTWALARKLAVEKFYSNLKSAGCKTIFTVVDVNIPKDKLLENGGNRLE